MRGLLLAATLLLAGCCSVPLTPAEVPANAPAEGGSGARTVQLTVLGPDEPAHGVPVFFFWEANGESKDGRQVLYALGLRTDQGVARAKVPPEADIWVAAGTGAWTEEWVPDVALAGTASAQATIRVYPRLVNGTLTDSWSPAGLSAFRETGSGPIAWKPYDILPGASEESRTGYAKRLAVFTLNVTWTNEATDQADLGLAAFHRDAGADAVRCLYQDTGNQLAMQGPQREQFSSRESESDFSCGNFMDTPEGSYLMHAGPATGRPALMPFGMPFEMGYQLEFGHPSDIEELCDRLEGDYLVRYLDPVTGDVYREESGDEGVRGSPAPAAILFLLLMLALGFLVRRRVA